MSNFRERFAVTHVEVSGQRLVTYKDAAKLERIPGTDLYVSLENLTVGEIAKAAALEGSYDYALPQDWFDEYLARYKTRPIGVWWYPKRGDEGEGKYWLCGRFVSVKELLERVGETLIRTGQAERIEGR